ncbi:MAG: DegT/DnrJ/EryC1/StrS family aminotransferase [Candidatus Nealsonbacteria bacterium]
MYNNQMYFVHPQIKLTKQTLKSFLGNFIKAPDLTLIKKEFSFNFPGKQLVFTDMARSAFKIAIEKLNLRDSKIVLPAYICDIFYPILKEYNIEPIFLDIELDTFHIKTGEDLQKIKTKAKAILVSHTYGLPIKKERIEQIKNLLLIEDCAHAFGATYGSTGLLQANTFVGNLGDVSFFSLYKQFPMFRGGLLVCPRSWEINLPKTNFSFRDFISFLNCFSFFAFLFKTFGQKIAPKFIKGEKTPKPASLNPVSLNFFSQYSTAYDLTLKKRKKLGLFFQKELKKLGFQVQESENNVFCYLSALTPKELGDKRDKLVRELKKKRVFCTRIWHTPIVLNPEVQEEYNLNLDKFPNTVEVAKRIINFPLQTWYSKKNIKKIILSVKKVLIELKAG